MKISKNKTTIYLLSDAHMARLDELITEIQCLYMDIFSNRSLAVTTGPDSTPTPRFVNGLAENGLKTEDILDD